MLPVIKTYGDSSSMSSNNFKLKMENVEDLFESSSRVNPQNELKKVQTVINTNKEKLNRLFTKAGRDSMNRDAFQQFVYTAIGIRGKTSNEIFSCVTDLYSVTDEEKDCGEDTFLTSSQFAAGVVRVANLFSMMNDGTSHQPDLSTQTERLISVL